MRETRSKRKVEFIESYWTGGELGSDYQWCDNHGELVRCKDCKYYAISDGESLGECMIKHGWFPVKPNWFCADGDMIETNQESAEDVTGLYCDDITFCWGPCDNFKCPRNKYNIRDKKVPHSFFAEGVVPDDCPKQKEKENR